MFVQSKKTCIAFLRGTCMKADNCEDLHLKTIEQKIDPSQFDPSAKKFIEKYSRDDISLFNFGMEAKPDRFPLPNEQLIIIRHGLSVFNYATYQFFYQTGIGFTDPRSKPYQVNKDYIDSELHPLGIEMCQNSGKHLNDIQFHTVFVSPLKRAIETAYYMFKDHPQVKQIKFVLLPLIQERVGVICDISDFQKLLQSEIILNNNNKENAIKFDLSSLNQEWQLDQLNSIRAQLKLDSDLISSKESTNPNQIQNACELLTDKLFHTYPLLIESQDEINFRAQKAKEYFHSYIKTNNIDTTTYKIGAVSHVTFIRTLTSMGINGEMKSFENCKAVPLEI